VKLDLLLLNTRDTIDRIIVADAPGWRKGSPAAELEKPPVQQILAEHRAADSAEAATTQYAAVITPRLGDESPVLAARLLANDADTGAMAVEVRFAERTDYLISTGDQQQRQYGPVSAAGQFAFVSVDDQGRAVQAYLLGGASLACGDLKISLPNPSATLEVGSVSDRTFYLAEPLPSGLAANGAYLIARGPEPISEKAPRPQTGFEIESTSSNSITVRDYPAIKCEEVTVLSSKWLQVEGHSN
jgi:hypothetical protein